MVPKSIGSSAQCQQGDAKRQRRRGSTHTATNADAPVPVLVRRSSPPPILRLGSPPTLHGTTRNKQNATMGFIGNRHTFAFLLESNSNEGVLATVARSFMLFINSNRRTGT